MLEKVKTGACSDPYVSISYVKANGSFDELLRDDDALELVGSLSDGEQRRIPVVALDVEFLGGKGTKNTYSR